MTDIAKRVVLLLVLTAASVLAIKGIFADPDITTQSGRYAWSAFTVLAAGVIYFVVDYFLDEV